MAKNIKSRSPILNPSQRAGLDVVTPFPSERVGDRWEELEKYKQQVTKKIDTLIPFFASAAIGDFSKDIPIPEEIDEFTELYVGIQLILEVAREKIAVLEKNRQVIEQSNHADTLLVVKADGQLLKINPEEILFIKAMADYMVIYTQTKRFVTHSTMKGILTKLNEQEFERVHRSYIVRLDKISSLSEDAIIVGEHTIPLSRARIKQLKVRFSRL